MFYDILLLLAGFAILIKGADFLVNGASSVAKKSGISNIAIGLTVVAFGTSTPELVVSIISALEGRNDASFGNVIGSNNFNLLFILGIAGLIYPLTVLRNTVKYEVPLSLAAAVLLFCLVNDVLLFKRDENLLSRADGFILLAFFVGFLAYVYRTMKHVPQDPSLAPIKIYKTPLAVGMALLGLIMLIGGGSLVVDNAVAIANHFGLSDKLIGLTILAAGTSLPELATSAVAAYRKNTDIAIGNVVGSNIFNIFFILGLTGTIHPIAFNTAMNFDFYVQFGGVIILMIFMFTINKRKLDRWEAFLLLLGYITYTIVLVYND
jgi:cation:H+ antiporter